MTLAPNYRLCPEDGKVVRVRRNRSAERAATRYRRLGAASACSLLELQPITGEWCLPRAGSALCALSSSSRKGSLSLEITGILFGTELWG